MEEMEDDFGELYADVECQVSLAIENDNKEELNNKMEVDEEEVMVDCESGSEEESEDDIHIVLNEEDCKGKGKARCNEDEDDGLVVIGGETDEAQIVSGVEKVEKGNGVKGSYYSKYSQYKYIRPHGAAFSLKGNGNGSAVSALSSLTRCDSNANGCNQHLGSTSGTVSSSGSTGFLVSGQSGCDFSLPRHRTILDVNIDAFDQKPWKYPGVDATDFFNFGLDEESWKHYCNNLEQFRQQSNVLTMTNQVYGAGFWRQTLAPESLGESAQTGQEGEVSPVLNNVVGGERSLEIPIGRAIRVEDSIGERRPSMDIRRPRNQDTDVIPVQEDRECSFSSDSEELNSCNSKLNASGNGVSSMDFPQPAYSAESTDAGRSQSDADFVKDVGICSLSVRRCSQPRTGWNEVVTDPDGQGIEGNPNVNGCHLHKEREEIQKNPYKTDPYTLEAESPLVDRIQHASSLSYSDSYIRVSSIGTGVSKEKIHKHARKQSSNSISGLRAIVTSGWNHSKGSGHTDCRTEHGENIEDSGNRRRVRAEQESHSRVRRVAETTNHVDDDEPASRFNRKVTHDENRLVKGIHRRERRSENDYFDGDDSPLYREIEIPHGHHSERFVGRPIRDAYPEHYGGKGHTKVRNEMDVPLRRHSDEREYVLKKTSTFRDNEARNRDHLQERGNSDWGLNGVTVNDSSRLTPDRSFHINTERCHWRRKIVDEKCFRRGAEDTDFVLNRRYREEYIQENCLRPVSYHNREREYLSENYDKHVSYRIPDRRYRDGGRLCPDVLANLSRDVVHDDEYRIHPDDESISPPQRELYVTYERGWHDTASPRPAMYDSRRSDGGVDLWRRIQHVKHGNSGRFDHMFRDCDNTDRVIYPDDYFHNEGSRETCQFKALDWPEDRLSSKHRIQGRMYAEEASLSYERGSRKVVHIERYDLTHSELVFDENLLMKDKKSVRRGETRDSVDKSSIISRLDLVDKDKLAAPRHRKSIGTRFVGWEGKEDTNDFRKAAYADSANKASPKINNDAADGCSIRIEGSYCRNTRTHTQIVAWMFQTTCLKVKCLSPNIINSIPAINSAYDMGQDFRKSLPGSGRGSKAGIVRFNGRKAADGSIDKVHKPSEHPNKLCSGKFTPTHISQLKTKYCHSIVSKMDKLRQKCPFDKYPNTQLRETFSLDEGQQGGSHPGINRHSEKITQSCASSEKELPSRVAVSESKSVGEYDSRRILETLAKMKKRSERFKEPIALKEPDKNTKPRPDTEVKLTESELQRPTRKRRWVGS
ncbi:hypothetical protein IFM89_009597 [Coptis chinensis]|uniref:Pre-mRNA polyadenylation factor Fip1 domain-containing protein n=1 Tax=Coptis chinensis TaxID=261450 RepID=A0A835IKY2_9MAGN|nr:hypothetical protein IFM89_009597 [Coptis chinensis]